MEPMKVKFTAYQLAFWCCNCGLSLDRENGAKGTLIHSRYKNLIQKSDCPFVGMRFKVPVFTLEPADADAG
jgi:hypothetical protein